MFVGGLILRSLPVFCSASSPFEAKNTVEWLEIQLRQTEYLPVHSALVRLKRACYAVNELTWYDRTKQVLRDLEGIKQALPTKRDRIQNLFREVLADPVALARLDHAKSARRRLGLSRYPGLESLKQSEAGIVKYEALLRGLRNK